MNIGNPANAWSSIAEAQAKAELEEERFREAVKVVKEKLRERARRPLWKRLFPWLIKIERS